MQLPHLRTCKLKYKTVLFLGLDTLFIYFHTAQNSFTAAMWRKVHIYNNFSIVPIIFHYLYIKLSSDHFPLQKSLEMFTSPPKSKRTGSTQTMPFVKVQTLNTPGSNAQVITHSAIQSSSAIHNIHNYHSF